MTVTNILSWNVSRWYKTGINCLINSDILTVQQYINFDEQPDDVIYESLLGSIEGTMHNVIDRWQWEHIMVAAAKTFARWKKLLVFDCRFIREQI